MTTGVPFFDVYLESLLDPDTIQHAVSQQSTTKRKSTKISVGFQLTRDIANSIRHPSTMDKNTHSLLLQLPPEIWLSILQQLPLCQIPELNLVCRRLFCIVRFKSCFWLHVRKTIYPLLYDLLPSLDGPTIFNNLTKLEWHSYTKARRLFGLACDYCYQGTGDFTYQPLTADRCIRNYGSSAALPVLSPSNNTEFQQKQQYLYLCLPCRQRHYATHPEPAFLDNSTTIPYTDAIEKYCLPESYMPKQSRLWEIEAATFGRRIHGGDVGIQAEKRRIADTGVKGPSILPRKCG